MEAVMNRTVAFAAVAAALVLCLPAAQAIVSERHLRGVNALDCDLEAGSDAPAMTFKLLVRAKERRLQLSGTDQPFGYEEVGESMLRFPLALAHGPALSCDLELPAGALACRDAADAANRPRLGLCLAAPN
jgi:hypothetical protein